MATKKNIAMMIATIKGIYPYYAKDSNIELLAKTWLLLLNDYDDNIINKALLLCLKENEQPPTPAHIIKKIKNFEDKPYATELWANLLKSFDRVFRLRDGMQYCSESQRQEINTKSQEIYENLPQAAKIYVGSYSEFLRMSRSLDTDTAISIEKTRFLKEVPNIQEQIEVKLLANSATNFLTESASNKNILK